MTRCTDLPPATRQYDAAVSLTVESFFAQWGFGVEARQQVERSGVVLANARMGKVLVANCS